MKCLSLIAALGLILPSVIAQSACNSVAEAIPTCAQSCIISAGSAIGCTASTDYACQCSSSSELQASAENCVISACGDATALQVVNSASAVCACIATAASGSAPASSAASTTASSSAASSSAAPSSTPSSGSAASTSVPTTLQTSASSGGACPGGSSSVSVPTSVSIPVSSSSSCGCYTPSCASLNGQQYMECAWGRIMRGEI